MDDESSRAMKPASPEQALFAEVLQRDTPEARAAYLDGLPVLRSTVAAVRMCVVRSKVLVGGCGSTWGGWPSREDA